MATGDSSYNILNGGGGNDTVSVGGVAGSTAHHNTLNGNAGVDQLYTFYSAHHNVLNGHDTTTGAADTSTDKDYLRATGESSYNILNGGGGNDELSAGFYSDDIGPHHNTLNGNAGADTLSANYGAHHNVLNGHDTTTGAGDTSSDADTLSVYGSSSYNVLNGGGGNDSFNLGQNSGETLHDNTLNGGSGTDSLRTPREDITSVITGMEQWYDNLDDNVWEPYQQWFQCSSDARKDTTH